MLRWVKEESKFSVLFVVSILSIMIPSLVRQKSIYEWVFMIMFSAMVIAGTLTIRLSRKHSRISLIWSLITLVISWLLFMDITLPIPAKLGNLPFLAFFYYMVYYLIISILDSKNVTPDVIFGAITGYIYLGYCGGIYFIVISDLYPGSFAGNMADPMNPVYFSFVTMTTLGYGDITPISHAAKGGSIIVTILGQFYIAVIVALLVSKYMAHRHEKKKIKE